MSVPHVLSFSRVVAGPIVAVLILGSRGDGYLVAAILFAFASLTDLADGKLARYAQQASPLGVFLDTTADKVLVALTLVALAIAGLAAAWVPLVIIGREFLISGLRSYAASRDCIISAHIWGKGKTAVTMVAVVAVLLVADGQAGGVVAGLAGHGQWRGWSTAASWLLALAAALTLISGARYVVDAWPLLQTSEESASEIVTRPRAIAGGKK